MQRSEKEKGERDGHSFQKGKKKTVYCGLSEEEGVKVGHKKNYLRQTAAEGRG